MLDIERKLQSIIKNSSPENFGKDLRDLLGHAERQTNKEIIFKNYRIHWDNGKREFEKA